MPQQITTLPPLPPRPADAHKGTFGTVIVVGGCLAMPGAPTLTATAALRSGAGLVKIATDRATLPLCLTQQSSCTGVPMGDDAGDACSAIENVDPKQNAVLAVGPGMGTTKDRESLVLRLLAGERAVVLDADGLNLLARAMASGRCGAADVASTKPRVLTPHPGEFRRLAEALKIDGDPIDPASRVSAASQLAGALQAVVLLKGWRTIVADGQRYYMNTTGNPALATAGSGDVLTGLIAGLMAQGMSPFDAACLGSFIHGKAADLWAADHGTAGMLAVELAARIPDVLAALRGE
jgi:NAD(P)H-hydrate epimerase